MNLSKQYAHDFKANSGFFLYNANGTAVYYENANGRAENLLTGKEVVSEPVRLFASQQATVDQLNEGGTIPYLESHASKLSDYSPSLPYQTKQAMRLGVATATIMSLVDIINELQKTK